MGPAAGDDDVVIGDQPVQLFNGETEPNIDFEARVGLEQLQAAFRDFVGNDDFHVGNPPEKCAGRQKNPGQTQSLG